MDSKYINTWFTLFLYHELEYFSTYSERIEEFLSQQSTNLEQEFKNQIEALQVESDEEAQTLYEMHYEEEFHSFNNHFPTILRTSLFTTMYSYLEKQLNQLCKMFEKENKVKLSDLKHSGIGRAKNYLSKVCNIDFPSRTDAWNQITNYQKIRNIITHQGNEISIKKSEKTNISLFNSVVGIRLVDRVMHYEVKFDEEFCEGFSKILYSFFASLEESLDEETCE
ncbi:hypothetical protein [Virgibacillus halodenitrificans]|uniref:Cthe-2314-like HEPN domain-containing protein n=1 Tax=Virgibacillus halodenitrificans TaxID=1482 RepID=A0ABR7VLG2_VIRHA|nr:hypothetical protein [Virgibacillus halodenitrificans]MBD1222762.1 hypothetical protein [Virgibacillus halodenitrificans]